MSVCLLQEADAGGGAERCDRDAATTLAGVQGDRQETGVGLEVRRGRAPGASAQDPGERGGPARRMYLW